MAELLDVVVHVLNLCTQEVEAGRSLCLGSASSTQQVLGQPGLHQETFSQKPKPNGRSRKAAISSSICVTGDVKYRECVMVHLHCQLDWILNLWEDTLLDESLVLFLESCTWGWKSYPECGWNHPISWSPGLSWLKKMSSALAFSFLPPDPSRHEQNSLVLLLLLPRASPSTMPSYHDELCLHIINKK